MAIRKYQDEAAYAADTTRPANESNESLAAAESEIIVDGCNVRTEHPACGDIVVIANGEYFFVKRETFKAELFPSSYVFPAVVESATADEAIVIERANESKAMLRAFLWELTGFTLDGTDRTGTLQLRDASDSWAANHDHVISYNAESLESLAEQLNTAFAADSVLTAQKWVARIEGAKLMLYCQYSAYQQISSNTATAGFTLTKGLDWWVANSNMRRYSGARSGEGAISNLDRALAYFRSDLSSATYNPSSDVTSIKRGYPVCLPAYLGTSTYQSDHCALLRSTYGEGEEGWLKFMESCRVVPRQRYGIHGDKMTAKEITDRLASIKVALMGEETETNISPAAAYIAAKGYDCDGMRQGDWEAKDADGLRTTTSIIKYGTDASRNADPLNAGLYAIGGSAISNGSGLWSVSRYYSYRAWFSYGTGGVFSGNGYFHYTYVVLGVAHLNLRKP